MKTLKGMRIIGFKVCWKFSHDKIKEITDIANMIKTKYDQGENTHLRVYTSFDRIIVCFGIAIIGELLNFSKQNYEELDSIDPYESWKKAYRFFIENQNLVDGQTPEMQCAVITRFYELSEQPMANFIYDRLFVNHEALMQIRKLRKKK